MPCLILQLSCDPRNQGALRAKQRQGHHSRHCLTTDVRFGLCARTVNSKGFRAVACRASYSVAADTAAPKIELSDARFNVTAPSLAPERMHSLSRYLCVSSRNPGYFSTVEPSHAIVI